MNIFSGQTSEHFRLRSESSDDTSISDIEDEISSFRDSFEADNGERDNFANIITAETADIFDADLRNFAESVGVFGNSVDLLIVIILSVRDVLDDRESNVRS